jgi:hypothetical protein
VHALTTVPAFFPLVSRHGCTPKYRCINLRTIIRTSRQLVRLANMNFQALNFPAPRLFGIIALAAADNNDLSENFPNVSYSSYS